MALILLPKAFGFTSIDFKLQRASSTARSRYTGRSQRIVFPMAYWRVEGRLVDYDGQEAANIRGFLMQLEGVKNVFRFPIPGYSKPSNTIFAAYIANDLGTIAACATRAVQVVTTNFAVAGHANNGLKTGEYFNIGDELKVATADATFAADGQMTIKFQPPTRQAYPAGSRIKFINPTCAMRAEDDDVANWDIKPPYRHSVVFAAVEDFETLPIPLFSNYHFAMPFKTSNVNGFWSNGTKHELLSTVPGYTFTRTGQKGERNALTIGDIIDDFNANIPAVIPGVGYYSRPQYTNYALWSQDLSNAVWTKTNATITADAAIGPNGAMTADRVVFAAVAAESAFVNQQVQNSAAQNRTWTISAFVKRNVATDQPFRVQCTHGANANYYSPDKLATSEWQKFVFKATFGAGVGSVIGGIINNSVGAAADLLVSDIQIIEGQPLDGGPIIVTNSTGLVVAEDKLTFDNVLVDEDMLIWATGTIQDNQPTRDFLTLTGGTANTMIRMYASTTSLFWSTTNAGVAGYGSGSADFVSGQRLTMLMRRKAGQWRGGKVLNNVLTWVSIDQTFSFPPVNKVSIGNYVTGGTASGINEGSFVKKGTFADDAAVLAAINESMQ